MKIDKIAQTFAPNCIHFKQHIGKFISSVVWPFKASIVFVWDTQYKNTPIEDDEY